MNKVTVSIVSHEQSEMVHELLEQIAKNTTQVSRVIVTHNIKCINDSFNKIYPFEVINIQNNYPLGFGANHNNAFDSCVTSYFCVMNPDIQILEDPFKALLSCLEDSSVALVSPCIKNLDGKVEDNARFFPTPIRLIKKVLFGQNGSFPIDLTKKVNFPDWVAGMFLVFPTSKYIELNGFDDSYFLYYEDVDICTRIWKNGSKVGLCSLVTVIHDAQRSSHKNFKYLKWHITSALRFYINNFGRLPKKVC